MGPYSAAIATPASAIADRVRARGVMRPAVARDSVAVGRPKVSGSIRLDQEQSPRHADVDLHASFPVREAIRKGKPETGCLMREPTVRAPRLSTRWKCQPRSCRLSIREGLPPNLSLTRWPAGGTVRSHIQSVCHRR